MNYSDKATVAHKSLFKFYGSENERQYLNNFYPLENKDEDNKIFNYWWLAHEIDVLMDGYLRTNDKRYLDQAIKTYEHSKARNNNTLIHVYYDDMLWNALAMERLYNITKDEKYLKEAIDIWNDLVDTGWNDIQGGGFAWRKIQMDYKNTPVNCPFIILSARLHKILGEDKYLDWALKTYEWQKRVLINPETSFAEDGINRLGDGEIDKQWKFTYNQGVYIGANLELYEITKEEKYIKEAVRNAYTTIKELTVDGVFIDEGDGGDIGLFKGIFYRYVNDLIILNKDPELAKFVKGSCDVLWKNCFDGEFLLVNNDWRKKANGKLPYSTQLSGIMALEMASVLEKLGII